MENYTFNIWLFTCPSYHQEIGYKSKLHVKFLLLIPGYELSLCRLQSERKIKGQKKLNVTNQKY